MNWFKITVCCVGFASVSLIYIIFNNIKFAKLAKGSKPLEHDAALQIFQKFVTFFKDFNAEIAKTVCSEMFYYSITTELKSLQKIGIRKAIAFKANNNIPLPDLDVRLDDGKNNYATGLLIGDYEEKYISTENDNVLYMKKIPLAMLILSVIRSVHQQGKDEFYCSNCGKPLQVEADHIVCSGCGTKYSTESKDWSLTDVRVMNYKAHNIQTNLLMATVVMVLGLSFFGKYLIPAVTFNVLMFGFNAFLVLLTLYYLKRLSRIFKVLQEISRRDPNFSRMVFTSRIEYLINLYFKAKSFNPYLIKPFSDKEFFEKLQAGFSDNNEVLIDLEIKVMEPIGYEEVNDHQVVTVKAQLNTVVVTPKKKVKKKKVKAVIKLARHSNTQTQIFTEADYMPCEGCGASINLAADGLCKYCGSPIDLSKYDWILVAVN